MKHAHFRLVSAIRLVLATAAPRAVAAQTDVFQPLLADPKEPRFFASYLWDRSPHLASQVSSVGLGQTIEVFRSPNGRLQASVAAGVFSQFSMRSASNDLINTDYIIGFPISYRHGSLSGRLRLYHQSSHLGDEFLLRTHTQRVDLTFEAAEILVSEDIANWRVYGGGEYIFRHEPADLKPGLLHGGLEYRQPAPLVRLGRWGAGYVVAAFDGKSFENRNWQLGWSLASGLEFVGPRTTEGTGRRWSILLQGYRGPVPYGQFYRESVSWAGLGLAFAL